MKKGKIKNVTVSYKNNKYYASIMVETDLLPNTITKIDKSKINALDYKSNGLYQDKNGVCNMPNWYKKSEKKLITLAIVLALIILLPTLLTVIGDIFGYDLSCFA